MVATENIIGNLSPEMMICKLLLLKTLKYGIKMERFIGIVFLEGNHKTFQRQLVIIENVG